MKRKNIHCSSLSTATCYVSDKSYPRSDCPDKIGIINCSFYFLRFSLLLKHSKNLRRLSLDPNLKHDRIGKRLKD